MLLADDAQVRSIAEIPRAVEGRTEGPVEGLIEGRTEGPIEGWIKCRTEEWIVRSLGYPPIPAPAATRILAAMKTWPP